MNRFGWALFGALALTGTGAMAVHTDESFKDIDENKDGYVSASETKDEAALSRYWYKFDENKDGALDMSEFSAFDDAKLDDLEPYILRHDWYGSVGIHDLSM